MLAWIGFGGTGLAIWFWNYGASRLGTTIATVNLNVVPVIAVLTSMALGHYPTIAQLVGGAVVIAGVLWVQFSPTKR
jgi:drug/metabolite transporter (DMT)-like permease